MAFEKEKRNNNIVLAIGTVLSLVGVLLCFYNLIIGLIVLIVGISLLLMGWSISSIFYKIKMKELLESKRRSN